MMYTVAVLALMLAGAVFTLSIHHWHHAASGTVDSQGYRSAVQRFREGIAASASAPVDVSPLVVEAQAFARHLNPPQKPEKPVLPVSRPTVNPAPSAPVVRPATPSVLFRLCATSYYPNEPGRSMALVSDVGSAEGDQRWVKEGAKLGHFVVHEIRRGMIVYRDGEQLREMAVERGTALPRLVRDPRPASPTARAATSMVESVLPILSEPGNIDIGGD